MDCVDRISELPEPILHTILSKLPDFEDACRTSVLSKRWRLLWESFPDLNFNEESFAPGMLGCDVLDISDQAKVKKISSKREKFINFVNETVSRRCQNNNMIRIHMFRLEITFPRDMSLVTRMDYWIRRAADANVEVLFLYVQAAAAAQNDWWYKLPEVVFASKTITTLYLQFCRFEPNGDIRLPLLQKLSLVNAYIKEQTFQKLLSSCSRIEYLVVDSCEEMDNLIVASSKLDTVKVKLDKSHWLGKVEIKAPDLQAFQFCGEELPCEEINITSCRNLRRVMLSGPGFGVTDCFVSELFSQLPQLESLTLSQCRKVEYVYISSHRLKVLKLYFCPNLIDVKIDAPNLLYFEFGGSNQTCFLVMNTSNDLQVRLCIRHAESINLRFFESIKVSKNFDRCNVLTLEALFLRMKAFHTEELREELLPLLYNVKHLKLIIGRLTMHGIVSLVDGLLRICPGVEKFSILSGLDYKSLEFVYGEQIMGSTEDEGSTYCCRSSHPHRCWRHFLREVTIVNFQNAVFERYLEGFFVQNVKTLKMVRVLD